MKRYLLLLLTVASLSPATAQSGRSLVQVAVENAPVSDPNRGVISGSLTSQGQQIPVGFATVALFRQGETQPFRGTQADQDGAFVFEKLPFGDYQLRITEIGHQPLEVGQIQLSDRKTKVSLAALKLTPDVKQLAEVRVTSNIGATQISPGKTVFRVADLPVAQGGTAGDILKLMPSVGMGGPPGVPRDVRFRGLDKAYTLVLIDGKNAGIQGNQREVVVNQIPASAVERIEIISNPGPQYDADGISGVVNIILKKNYQFGTHGTAGLFLDNRRGYNASLGLAHRMKKAEVFLNFDRNQANFKDGFTINETTRQTRLKNGVVDGFSDITATEWRDLPSQNLKVGARFYPSVRSSLSVEYLNGFQNETRVKTTDTKNFDKTGKFKDRVVRTEDRNEYLGYQQWGTEWKQSFRQGGNLTVSGSFVRSDQPKPRTQTDQKTTEAGQAADTKPAIQRVEERALDRNFFGQADFFQPISAWYAFRVGYKFSGRRRESTQATEKCDYAKQAFLPSASGTDNFRYDEDIHAAYVNNEFTLGRLRTEVGFRHEYVAYTSASILKSTEATGRYHMPLPTVNVFYNLDSTQFLKASIGRRIRRPEMKQLNPFIDNSDPTKIKAGNPDLQPERAWAYEIGYLKNFRRFNVGVNLFRRDLDNVMQKHLTDVSPGVVLERHENFGAAYIQGVEFITAIQPVRWLNLNANYSRFDSRLKNEATGGGALQDQFNWSAKLIADVTLARPGLTFQAAYNAVGPKVSAQKTENAITYLDFVVSKRLNARGNLNLRVVDALATNRKTTLDITTAQTSERLQAAPGRLMSVGYTYTF